MAGFWPFVSLLLVVGCDGRAFYPLPSKLADANRQPLQTSRPYNIAHRGSNGELPEETEPAYKVGFKYDKAIIFPFLEISYTKFGKFWSPRVTPKTSCSYLLVPLWIN